MKRIAFSAYRRFFLLLFAVVGLALMALMWKGVLPGSLSSAQEARAVPQAATPALNLNVPGTEFPNMALVGETFCYTARITNTGDLNGPSPYLRLSLPPSVTIDSVTALGICNLSTCDPNTSYAITPINSGTFTSGSATDSLCGMPVPGTTGNNLWLLQPPAGSLALFSSTKQSIDLKICLKLDTNATVNSLQNICHQPVFLLSNTSCIEGAQECKNVMASVVKFRKRVPNAPLNDDPVNPAIELPVGSSVVKCNGTKFELVADIANGKTLTDLVFDDVFPTSGNDLLMQLIASSTGVTGSGSFTIQNITELTSGAGVKVTISTATGTASTDDVVVGFTAYATTAIQRPDCAPGLITNTGTLNAKFNGNNITPLSDQLKIEAKNVAMQKKAAPTLVKPGDTVNYTLNVQVSEDVNARDPYIEDTLPNGISFDSGSTTIVITPKSGQPFSPPIFASATQTGGKTLVTFTFNNGQFFTACDKVEIKYKGTVEPDYAPPISQPVIASDKLVNTARIGYINQPNNNQQCYGNKGEGAVAEVVVSPPQIEKSIVNPKPEYAADDDVIFKLKMCLPSGDAKEVMFKDFLPPQLFDVSSVNLGSTNITLTVSPSGITPPITLATPTADPINNSLMFTFTQNGQSTLTTNGAQPLCLEVEFTAKITIGALPDKLTLANVFQGKVKNLNGDDYIQQTGVTLNIGAPKLTITKSVCAIGPGTIGTTASGNINNNGNVDGADAGDKLTYCITIKNESQSTAYKVVFKDEVPAGLTYVPNSLVVTGAAIDTSILPPKLQTQPQLLAPGGMITVQYMATMNNTAAPCQPKITNTAKVEWASSSTGQATSSATETAEVNFAKPTIMKTVKGGKTATIGETVTFEIKVCMPEGTASGVVVTDTFPFANLTFDSVALAVPTGVQITPSTITGPGPWTFSQIIVPGNNITTDNCFTIEITGKVADVGGNKNGTVFKNIASMTIPGCPAVQSASGDVTVIEPVLTFKKEFVPVTAKPGDVVTVNLTITNTGSAPAYDAKVLDNLPPNLINPTGTALQSGFTLTITGQQVLFSGGTVPANGSVVLTIKATAHVPCGNVQNTATLTDASTLSKDMIGERKYPTISSVATLNIMCDCLNVVPYLVNKNMTGWWPLDETTVTNATKAADIAGFANVGSHISATATPGLVSGALQFNGTTSYVNVPDHSHLNFGKSSFSIDAWVMTTKVIGTQPIVDKRVTAIINNTFTTTGYRLYLENGRLAAQVATTTYIAPTTSPNVADGNWHHVALTVSRPTFGAKSLALYVDGVQVSTASPNSAGVTTSAPLWIGRGVPLFNLDKPFFAGKIDEVELFKVALTAAEVQSLYKAGSAGKCKPVCALACPPTTLPNATLNQTYPLTPIITGGVSAYVPVDPVTLPPGMNLTASGHLTGTPTMTGKFSFSITVTDQNGCSKTCVYEIEVVCGGLTITNPSQLPNGSLGSVYNQTLTAQGGCGDYVFKQIGGLLPPGVTLTSDGKLIGPGLKSCGTFDFEVQVTDKCGCIGKKTFSIIIEGPPLAVFNTGVNLNKTVRSPGQSELNYVATQSNGTPFSAIVINKQASWVSPTNNPNPSVWIGPSVPQTTETIYSLTLDLTNCSPNMVQIEGRYAASGSGYITINTSTTQIAPTTNGPLSFTKFTLPGSSFISGINTIKFHIPPAPGPTGLLVEFTKATCCPCMLTVGPNTLLNGTINKPYNGQFTATGGTPPYIFQVTVTPPVPGIVFGSNGQISGTPLMCGDYTISVKAIDSQDCIGIRQYTLKINCSLTDIGYETNDMPGSGLVAQEPTPSQLIAHINYQALGDEKAVRFSLGFDPALLSNPLVTLGSGFQNAALDLDVSELDQGNLGVSVAVPDGQAFAEGRSELVTVVWEYAGTDRGKATRIEFKDSPIPRAITDQSGAPVETQFKPSPIVLAPKAAIVSAASYRGERIAPEEIVAAFGVRLATATQIANTLPLPTTLAGTTIKVRDSANVERLAPLFFVAPTQINYLIPAGTAAGAATVIITGGDGAVSGSVVEITNVEPGIFVADASGRGLPAANALTFKADGAQSSQPVARFDTATSRFVAVPIDLGGAGDRVFLSLFGTGVRHRSSLENVRAIIGGVEAPVLYAGEQGGFAGLDQINLEIPRSLAGSGLVDVVLIVDGAIANVVQISIL